MQLDTVIMSLGTSPNPLIASTTKGLETNKRKCIVAEEENGQTSKAAVFAGGDAVTGAATVILAMGAGKAEQKEFRILSLKNIIWDVAFLQNATSRIAFQGVLN